MQRMSEYLSILLVTWNQRDAVLRCLNNIIDQYSTPIWEILLFDNASTDHTSEIVSQMFSSVKVLSGDRNIGFAKGVNILVRKAQGRACLLLNPDAEIQPETIKQLFGYLMEHPEVGVVGPFLQNREGRWQPSGGKIPTPGGMLRETILFDRFFPPFKPLVKEVGWLAGTVMLLPRDLAQQLGPFDEQFFLYFEDVDLCRRVWATGREVHFLPEAVATHEERAGRWFSSRYFSTGKIAAYTRSEILYFRKWWPSAEGWVRGVLLLRSLLRSLVWVIFGLVGLGGPRKAVGERVKGYWISAKIAIMG